MNAMELAIRVYDVFLSCESDEQRKVAERYGQLAVRSLDNLTDVVVYRSSLMTLLTQLRKEIFN